MSAKTLPGYDALELLNPTQREAGERRIHAQLGYFSTNFMAQLYAKKNSPLINRQRFHVKHQSESVL